MIPTSKSISVIGDEDLILGLEIFGFDTLFVESKEKITQLFKEVLEKKYLVCFIQEKYFPQIKNLFLEIEDPFPLVLAIPDHIQIKGLAKDLLRKITLKAIGADILR